MMAYSHTLSVQELPLKTSAVSQKILTCQMKLLGLIAEANRSPGEHSIGSERIHRLGNRDFSRQFVLPIDAFKIHHSLALCAGIFHMSPILVVIFGRILSCNKVSLGSKETTNLQADQEIFMECEGEYKRYMDAGKR